MSPNADRHPAPDPTARLVANHDLARFAMRYKFAVDEVNTKMNILREEFRELHDYNPIEHLSARLKTPESILAKALRRGIAPTIDDLREHVRDIAGVRVVCSFLSDVRTIFELFTSQDDVTVIDIDDYITHPKANGYRSLHVTVQVPVFLSTGREQVYVEMQFRTVAMDFWASLEHKIFYKYDRDVPTSLVAELRAAADTATMLDERMQRLHREVASFATDRHAAGPSRTDRAAWSPDGRDGPPIR